MSECKEYPLVEFLQEDLEPEATALVAEHLARCEACRERIEVMICLAQVCSVKQPCRQVQIARRLWPLAAAVALAILAPLAPWVMEEAAHSPREMATAQKYPSFPLRTRSDPDPGQTLRDQAFRAYREDDFSRAERLFSELPQAPETLFYRGLCFYMQGDISRSVALLSQASESDPRWKAPGLWYQANAWLKGGNVVRARRLLEELSKTSGPYREESRKLLEGLAENPR